MKEGVHEGWMGGWKEERKKRKKENCLNQDEGAWGMREK